MIRRSIFCPFFEIWIYIFNELEWPVVWDWGSATGCVFFSKKKEAEKSNTLFHCCGSASTWCGSGFDLLLWCGSGFWFLFDADADPDPTFHPDADPDPNPDSSFQCLNRLIFHTFWLVICKSMRIRIRFRVQPITLMRIRILIFNWSGCGFGSTTLYSMYI